MTPAAAVSAADRSLCIGSCLAISSIGLLNSDFGSQMTMSGVWQSSAKANK